MNKSIFCALLAGALLTSPALMAQQVTPAPTTQLPQIAPLDQAQVRAVTRALSGYHALPSRDQLVAASPQAEQIVLALVSDASTSPFIRPRAIGALAANWPSAKALEVMRAMLQTSTTREATRHQLLLALPAFGQQVIPDLVGYLRHDDLQLRLSAVEALGQLRQHEPAVQALYAALDTETSPLVRERIKDAARTLR